MKRLTSKKAAGTAYAAYVVAALRKSRADMVSDLEHYFGLHWRIDEATGKSVFYI